MKVTTLSEEAIRRIGHAFGYYDYGDERGLIDAFPSRDAAAEFICGYVRMALKGGMLYATGADGEGYIAYKCPGQKVGTTPTRVHQRLSQNNLRKRQISCETTADLSK